MEMIERASEEHAKKILYVINESNRKAYRDIIPEEHFREPVLSIEELLQDFSRMSFYVYRHEGEIVGVAALDVLDKDTGRIRWVYVLPEFQRKGIGTALVTYVEHEAERFGLKKLWLITAEKAYWAIDFYRKLGYRQTGRIERPWGNDLIMEKEIH